MTTELQIKLNQVKSQKYWAYFEQNIWYDTLTILAQLLQANPSSSNLQKDWSNILQSIDLSNIIQKPIVKIYQ